MKRAAIFDMDGLLIDSEPLWRQAEIHCFKKVGLTLTEDDCRQTMGWRLNEVVDHWYSRSPWPDVSSAQVEEDILNSVIDHIHSEGKPMPGVHQALDLFESQGYELALASSSAMVLIEAVLEKLKLKHRFKVVRSAQNEIFGKPHPQVFITTAEQLEVDPENCIVLEDSFHGVIAGKAAKMKVIAVPDHSDRNLPGFGAADLIVNSLEELDEHAIRQLFGH